jgi:signal transduction histidine kinase
VQAIPSAESANPLLLACFFQLSPEPILGKSANLRFAWWYFLEVQLACPSNQHDLAPVGQAAGISMRAERLLSGMHKVLSHDLPNQIVAVQGLLQLLSLEEANRLTPTGLEYVRRLHKAAGRAAEMVRFLKEMERLRAFTARREAVALETLARELQGEMRRRFPKVEFEFSWQWDIPTVSGDTRVYLPALQELFIDQWDARGEHCQITGASLRHGDKIELAFSVFPAEIGAAVEPRMGTILAGEWLTLVGATIEMAPPETDASLFAVLVPNR